MHPALPSSLVHVEVGTAPPPPLTLEKTSSRLPQQAESSESDFYRITVPPAEFDLENGPGGRLDEPGPVQLETRGVTSQPAEPRIRLPKGAQGEFWATQTQSKFAIAAKLREAGRADLAEALEDCHAHYTHTVCNSCGATGKFPNRCDVHYCPECQPRLAKERRESVEWWTKEVSHPLHIVLTLRNQPELSKRLLQEAKDYLSALRRRKFTSSRTMLWEDHAAMDRFYRASENGASWSELDVLYKRARTPLKAWRTPTGAGHTITSHPWNGGFYSMEITNEGAGWHVHFHVLADCQFCDAAELARQWAAASNNSGYIVRVLPCTDDSYLKEVTKYCVKGTQLASWSPLDVRSFVEALDGVRAFGVFGSLYRKRSEFAEWLASLREDKPLCDCGSCDLTYYTESEWIERDLQPHLHHKAQAPPPAPQTPDLPFAHELRSMEQAFFHH